MPASSSYKVHALSSPDVPNSGLDAGIKLRPNVDELKAIGPAFDARWKEFFVPAPDKPVMWLGPIALFVISYQLSPFSDPRRVIGTLVELFSRLMTSSSAYSASLGIPLQLVKCILHPERMFMRQPILTPDTFSSKFQLVRFK